MRIEETPQAVERFGIDIGRPTETELISLSGKNTSLAGTKESSPNRGAQK